MKAIYIVIIFVIVVVVGVIIYYKRNKTNKSSNQPNEEQIYLSVDGDDIGKMVARAAENDDERLLSEVSSRINSGQALLTNWTAAMGGQVIQAGGDEGLVKVPTSALSHVDQLREVYRQTTGTTCTIGVGKKMSQATKARMLGKSTGKNCIVIF